MKATMAKVKSRKGASITFALLLFLVCAVVSSVVVVAGSAAGGRISQMRESDQRYYAATSAAELISRKLAAGPAITVTRSAAGAITVEGSDDNLLKAAAEKIVTAMADGEPKPLTINLTASPDTLNCTINVTARNDGLLDFEIRNGPTNKQYTLYLRMASSIKKTATADGGTKSVVTWKVNGISNVRPEATAAPSGGGTTP